MAFYDNKDSQDEGRSEYLPYRLEIEVPVAGFDIAFASINDLGTPGRLNRAVIEAFLYSEEDLPNEKQLSDGFFLLEKPGKKPIVFIVTVTPDKNPIDALRDNFYNAMKQLGRHLDGRRVWLPLMATGSGRLSPEASLEVTVDVLDSLAMEFDPPIVISLPRQKWAYELIEKQTKISSEKNVDRKTGYWLLKMNPSTWFIDDMSVGDLTYMNTYWHSNKRPEYENFVNTRIGDLVIGYAGKGYNCVVCTMKVTEGIHHENSRGEIFRMEITALLEPRISLGQFRDIIPRELAGKLEKNDNPLPELFFPLSDEQYQGILGAAKMESKEITIGMMPGYLTEGDHTRKKDSLDFKADIESFATVIAMRDVKPPLAIGLFGHWGSGKSFFMENLAERIREKAGSESQYVKHIVPIRFNSWHYSDTNILVSLVAEVYNQLSQYLTTEYGTNAVDTLYKDLQVAHRHIATTQEQLKIKKAELVRLEEKSQAHDAKQKEIEEELTMLHARNIIGIVWRHPRIKALVRKFNTEFKTAPIGDNLDEIDDRIGQLNTTFQRFYRSVLIARQYSKGNGRKIILLFLFISCILCLAIYLNKDLVSTLVSWVGYIISILTTAIISFSSWLAPYRKMVNRIYHQLKDLKTEIEAERNRIGENEDTEYQRLKTEQSRLDAEISVLAANLEGATENVALLKSKLEDIRSGKVLSGWLSDKVVDDAYIKQMGIVSHIRRDFDKLNRLFEEHRTVVAKEGQGNVTLSIDRMVLYIDDLDRCNENVVIKVLEAIHLLLAYPLFVVIVGVDPRWLNNALAEKYKTLLIGVEDNVNGTQRKTVATTYDYLEKIFQIPFTLKPMKATGCRDLISSLLSTELQRSRESRSEIIPSLSPRPANRLEKKEDSSGIPFPRPENELVNSVETVPDRLVAETALKQKFLEISEQELEYIQALSPLFGHTARTVTRYVNIYRLIKAHTALKIDDVTFGEREFMPVMFLLAIVVGRPMDADSILRSINQAPKDQLFSDFLGDAQSPEGLYNEIYSLCGDLKNMQMGHLRRNVDLVSRFSFHMF